MRITKYHMIFLLTLWAIFSVLLVGEEIRTAAFYKQLVDNSNEYSALVTKGEHSFQKGRKGGSSELFSVSYEFRGLGGKLYYGNSFVERSEYLRLESITSAPRTIKIYQSRLSPSKHYYKGDWLRRSNVEDFEMHVAKGVIFGLMFSFFIFYVAVALYERVRPFVSRVKT